MVRSTLLCILDGVTVLASINSFLGKQVPRPRLVLLRQILVVFGFAETTRFLATLAIPTKPPTCKCWGEVECRGPDLHWGRQAFQACALLPELPRHNFLIYHCEIPVPALRLP